MSNTTPDKKNKKKLLDPRRLNLDEEPQTMKPKKKGNKQKDASNVAVVNPRMLPPTPTCCSTYRPVYTPSLNCCPTYRPVYTLNYPPPPLPVVSTPYGHPPPLIRGHPWNAMVAAGTPIQYSVPIPVTMSVPYYAPVSPQVCPYGALLTPPVLSEPLMHVLSPVPVTVAPSNHIFNFETAFYEQTVNEPQSIANNFYQNQIDEMAKKLVTSPVLSPKECKILEPEDYLQLPKDLFPTVRSLVVDPNPIIDQFCRVPDCENHSPWILDLELGVPKAPVTRPIATYDVQFNSIHCKNTPGAIHPGFESCNKEFKNVFLYYYDFAISNWYKGFVIMNSDRSVANFQSWLQVPMQTFGMCWP